MKYPEVIALNELYVKHKVEIHFDSSDFLAGKKYYLKTNFTLEAKVFQFYVDDEYNDVRFNNPLLNLCLVLRELEGYQYTQDYLVWCQERYLDPKNETVLANFRDLADIYREVEKILGDINSQVSDWDFEMGSGASSELRKMGSS